MQYKHTVDGRNPAPVDRWFIPLIGFQPSKVMQHHSRYHCHNMLGLSSPKWSAIPLIPWEEVINQSRRWSTHLESWNPFQDPVSGWYHWRFVVGWTLDDWTWKIGWLCSNPSLRIFQFLGSAEKIHSEWSWMIRKMGWMEGLPVFQHTNIASIVSQRSGRKQLDQLESRYLGHCGWFPTPKDQCYIYMGLSGK